MEYIIVNKKDETFLGVECGPSIERELSEHFCFYVPGYKFMPAYRNRVWDGKIRLFDMRKKTLYCGLYNYLKEFCEERGYSLVSNVEEYDHWPNLKEFNNGENIQLPTHISPRDYQLDALTHAIRASKSLLLSPTASGKSLIIYLAIRYFLQYHEGKILIIVPTTSLVEQMFSDFEDYSKNDPGFNTEEECYKIYGGAGRDTEKRVVISTWQSQHRLNAGMFTDYGMVIGDEAHQFKAKSLTSIMEKCVNARFKIGTTGTLDGTQTHQLVLEGLFGPVFKVTTTKDLMKADNLAQLEIDVILLKYDEQHRKTVTMGKYQEEIDFIVGYPARNNFICNLAIDQRGNTLILFNFVEKHGKPLHNLLSKKINKHTYYKSNRRLFYVSGETDVDTRESVREITEKEKDAIIVASVGTFSTGVNIRNLHNIIFASPSKSQIRVLQSIGRGLRKSDDGRNTKVFDIADDLQYKSKKNYTLDHAAERIKIYAKEKFNYKLHDINI